MISALRVLDVLRILDAGHDRQQVWIAMVFKVGKNGVHLLFLDHQLLIKLRGLRKPKTADQVERRLVLLIVGIGGPLEGNSDPRQRWSRPRNLG